MKFKKIYILKIELFFKKYIYFKHIKKIKNRYE